MKLMRGTVANNVGIESRKNLNDWRRTKPDDKPESNRKSCTRKQLPATRGHLQPQGIKSPRALLENVPIVARSDTSRLIKSMEYVPPPPRPSFDWWAAAKKPPAAADDGQGQTTKKQLSLPKQLQMSNSQAQRRNKQRAKKLVDEERQKAREDQKRMREEEREERRAQKEKQQLERQQAKADQARARETAEAEREAARLERERFRARAYLSAQRIAAKFRNRFAF